MAESKNGTETAAAKPARRFFPAGLPGTIAGFLGRHPRSILTLLCLVLWLPGIVSLPGLDRDESRFAQSSRQMLETGNYVDIRLGQVPRYKKPVGIYWLQSATTAAAAPFVGTQQIWTYRLASLLGAILAVWLTVWCARSLLTPEASFLAGALMAGTLILTAEAGIATTDAVLLACSTAMMGVVLRLYHAARNEEAPRPGTGLVLAGWAALALGILIKGPVAPGLLAVTLIGLCAWDREFKWLARFQPALGVPLLLAIVLPWLIAIALASDGAFFQQSLGNDFAAKLAGGQESHGALPGYYLLLSAVTLWPAILFIPPALAAAVPRHREPLIRFLLVWVAGWWLLVEVVPTKLPHYFISAAPALAILAAAWITGLVSSSLWQKIAAWIAGIQFLIGAAGLVAALVLLPRLYGSGDITWLWGVAAVGAILALTTLALFAGGKRGWAAVTAVIAGLVLFPAITAGAGPHLDRLWMTRRLAAQTIAHVQAGDPPPVLAGYDEPSMLFALGANLGLSDGKGAADIAARNGGLALIEDAERGPFLARLAEQQADATALETVHGFNYSRGRDVAVTIYRVGRLSN
ncbi:MAG TPA: glycosyltransferase family 39 protein [Rhizomicrobium sp.]|nr:glycosyltransferase family 39 protein [Rhizomicrobium sp.]